jgi:DNA-binding transcriptional MerR regulator
MSGLGSSDAPNYSIAAVSKLTGVSCHSLRVWERRYGFPRPSRSASGQRRYSDEQVRRLQHIADLLHRGLAIGKAIEQIRRETVASEDGPAPPSVYEKEAEVVEFVRLLWAGDLTASDAYSRRWAEQFGALHLIEHLILPAFVETGEGWFRRHCDVYQEHCATLFLREKLMSLVEAARRANEHPARSILIGTVQGDRHEGGLLLLNYALERSGWRVLNLGVDLPVQEIQKAVTAWRPDALGLSFVLSRNIQKRFQELNRIRGIPIFVGGRSILNYQGLARQHGLIPLPGTFAQVVAQIDAAYAEWAEAHAGVTEEPLPNPSL